MMLTFKAQMQLDDAHLAQAKIFLEAYHLEIGLLINFGAKSLQFKRVMHTPRSKPWLSSFIIWTCSADVQFWIKK